MGYFIRARNAYNKSLQSLLEHPNAPINLNAFTARTYDRLNPENPVDLTPTGDISSSGDFSKQGYIEFNPTEVGILGKAVTSQEEFYDGEISGSVINAYVTQSNQEEESMGHFKL